MGWLFLFGHNTDFDLFESGRFEPVLEVASFETEPAIAVKLTCFFEIVFQKIEDHYLSAGTKNFVRAGKRVRWCLGVMQCLTENDQVDALRSDGW